MANGQKALLLSRLTAGPLAPPQRRAAQILFCLCGIPLLLSLPATALVAYEPFRRNHLPERPAGSRAAARPASATHIKPAVAEGPAASAKED